MSGQNFEAGPVTWVLIAVWLVYALVSLVLAARTFVSQWRTRSSGGEIVAASLRAGLRRTLVLGVGHVFWAFLLAFSLTASIPTSLLAAVLVAAGLAIGYAGSSAGISRMERRDGRGREKERDSG